MTKREAAALHLIGEVRDLLRHEDFRAEWPETSKGFESLIAAFDAAPDDEDAGREESDAIEPVMGEIRQSFFKARMDGADYALGKLVEVIGMIQKDLRALAASVKERK